MRAVCFLLVLLVALEQARTQLPPAIRKCPPSIHIGILTPGTSVEVCILELPSEDAAAPAVTYSWEVYNAESEEYEQKATEKCVEIPQDLGGLTTDFTYRACLENTDGKTCCKDRTVTFGDFPETVEDRRA